MQIQIKAGVEEKKVARYARLAIRNDMPDQHRQFFSEREVVYVAVETGDARGPVATAVLVGPTGAL